MDRRKSSDPDLTPVTPVSAQEFLRDQCVPNFEKDIPTLKLERCPPCEGTGEVIEREARGNRYSIRHVKCWLCDGAKVVPEQDARDWIALHESR